MEKTKIMSDVLIIGLLLFGSGNGLLYWIRRRIFNRSNYAGLEVFANFEHKTVTRFSEKVIRMIGRILTFTGVLLVTVVWYNYHCTEKYRKQKEQTDTIKTYKRP
ncbi:hypothetical protein ACFJIV_28920 [Mucilaginibacter sp. UC70_90]